MTAPGRRFMLNSSASGLQQIRAALQSKGRSLHHGLRVWPETEQPLKIGSALEDGLSGVAVHAFTPKTPLDEDAPGNLASAVRLTEADAGAQLLLLGGTSLTTGPDGQTMLGNATVLRRWREYRAKPGPLSAGYVRGPGIQELITHWRDLAERASNAPQEYQEAGGYNAAVWTAAADDLQAALQSHGPLSVSEREVAWKAGFLRGCTEQATLANGGFTLFNSEKAPFWQAAHHLYPLQRQELFKQARQVCDAQRNQAPPDSG